MSLMGLFGSTSRLISSWLRYMKENMVKIELSVVPEMGMENLLPSSSKKSMKVVKERGLPLVNTASTLSFYLVTPRLSPSGK